MKSPVSKLSETKIDVLRERAVALATPLEPPAPESNAMEVLVFGISSEKYAVGSETVREVCSFKRITPVPCTPEFVKGIINLRGQIFSVINLGSVFGLTSPISPDNWKIVIIGIAGIEVGILVDDVLGVRRIPFSEIQEDLPTVGGIQAKFLYGITSDRTAIINVEHLLTDDSMVVHETVGP